MCFSANMFINKKSGLPAQTKKEIQIFKAILDNNLNKKVKIFEWGSGYSTIYYSQYLEKKGTEFEWHSIDNNKAWHEEVKSKVERKGLQPYVRLYLKEFLPFWEKSRWGPIPPPCGIFGPKSENEKAYVNFPRLLNVRFDIVIIDARFRRHCVQIARDVLGPEGIVILHDAQKVHYHVGLDNFQYRTFIDSGSWYPFQIIPNEVWIGSMQNSKIFEAMKRL